MEFLLGENGNVSLGSKLVNLMKQVEGEQVDVWWLDDNQGQILKALVFRGTQYICEAIAKPSYNRAKIEQNDTDRENRQIMSSYVATIESFGRRQKQQIEPVTIIDNRPAPRKTFTMPGLTQQKPTSWHEPELLAIPEDEFDRILLPAQSFVRTLKERF
jgi:hypothetical protein